MSQDSKNTLSNNNLRRLQGWARSVYPHDAHDRCAIVQAYLAQLDAELVADLVRQGWRDVFAAAERDWPEAFTELNQNQPEPAG
ncbi:MAG: hypothetical protein NDI75_02155 [Candidatus Didemnitutus sp.]|jgi:hypothetical protein|nr:hypothetical protein [Candidatus Didemnitutus sp.]